MTPRVQRIYLDLGKEHEIAGKCNNFTIHFWRKHLAEMHSTELLGVATQLSCNNTAIRKCMYCQTSCSISCRTYNSLLPVAMFAATCVIITAAGIDTSVTCVVALLQRNKL
jgi:hypothetical protein